MKEKIEELIPLLRRFKQNFTAGASDGDQAEKHRRSELSRCVRRSPGIPTLANGLLSTLEEIEKRSQKLLEKGTAARFLDKGEDSKGVAKLVERLREAITHYQVSEDCFFASSPTHRSQMSQQQAIYDRITNLAVSISWLIPVASADASVPSSSLLSTPS